MVMLVRLSELVGRISDSLIATIIAACFSVMAFGALDYLADFLLKYIGTRQSTDVVVQPLIIGVGAGIGTWLLLRARGERRKIIRDELQRVAELNHHIRNSLESLSHIQYLESNEQYKQIILDSVTRIENTLQHLFPAANVERRKSNRVGDKDGPGERRKRADKVV
jgi:hypothetical protein